MGAGILPSTIHNNKLYFLFGKENKYEDSASGFSDFGGGTDNNESFFETAVREGTEELTGFLGTMTDLRKMLKKHGTYHIDYHSDGYSPYRCHLFPMEYDPALPLYYNNNQKFLQRRLDTNVIKKSKIFEKEEIRWICLEDLKKMRPKFRCYFRNIVDDICQQREKIYHFIHSSLKKGNKKTRKYRDV
jgi:8-oxo-dGTP pyrophosphatase MutT (NUDIX family)